MKRDGRMRTHYEILGVNLGATTDEIKAAFRKLAQKHHPDKLQNATGEVLKVSKVKFEAAQEAYNVLGQEASRAAYDSFLRTSHNPLHHAPPTSTSSPHHPHAAWHPNLMGMRFTERFFTFSGGILWVTFMGLVFVKSVITLQETQTAAKEAKIQAQLDKIGKPDL